MTRAKTTPTRKPARTAGRGRPRAPRKRRAGRAVLHLGGDSWRDGWVTLRLPMWALVGLVVLALFLANPGGVTGQVVVGLMQFLDWLARPHQP